MVMLVIVIIRVEMYSNSSNGNDKGTNKLVVVILLK